MKKIINYLLLPFLPLLVSAQFQFIPISADYASFPSSDSLCYVQAYLTTFQGSLQYLPQENGSFKAEFSTELEVRSDTTLIESRAHKYVNTATDTSQLQALNQIVDIFNLQLPHGTYKAKMVITDLNSHKKGEYRFDLTTMEYKPSFGLSDIELCTQIKQDTTQNMFFKNGLRVVPNPRAVFDMFNPLLYYYMELEHLSYEQGKNNNYAFGYNITNAAGDTVRRKKSQLKSVAAPRLVEIGGMNVIALPKGVYFFNVQVTDLASGITQRESKKFVVYKPSKKKEQDALATGKDIEDHYLGMTDKELDREFKQAMYLVTSTDRKVYKQLTNLTAKQKFLTRFWRNQDAQNKLVPGTFRRVYLQRVEIANQKYHSMGREGWQTDMGRVFILYGEPDEYERNPNSIDMIPHVIWHYHNLEGGAMFVFADQEGFGNYRLIHSDYRKELQNPNWQELISKRTDNSTSPF